jgi:hypothetical protein
LYLPEYKGGIIADTLQHGQDLIHDPILLILLSCQRNAKQVLAYVHANNLISDPISRDDWQRSQNEKDGSPYYSKYFQVRAQPLYIRYFLDVVENDCHRYHQT